jgi:hypothetical protein
MTSAIKARNWIFVFKTISLRAFRLLPKKRGVTYSRSATGTGMPSWNAFRHARWGVSSALSMISKLPVLLRTAAEATQICCVGLFYIRFFGTLTIETNGVRQRKD